MNSNIYRVITEGEIIPGYNRDQVIRSFAQLLKLERQPKQLQQLFSGQRVILKKDLSASQAKAFVEKIQTLGLYCTLVRYHAASTNLITPIKLASTERQSSHNSVIPFQPMPLSASATAAQTKTIPPRRRADPVLILALLLALVISILLYYSWNTLLPINDTPISLYDSATPHTTEYPETANAPVKIQIYPQQLDTPKPPEQIASHTDNKEKTKPVVAEQTKKTDSIHQITRPTQSTPPKQEVGNAAKDNEPPAKETTAKENKDLARLSQDKKSASRPEDGEGIVTKAEVNKQSPLIRPNPMMQDRLITGKLGPKMFIIPAGSFAMGDTLGFGDETEKPVRVVAITKPFAMSAYEVTFAEYDRFARMTGRPLPRDQRRGRADRPVIHVSWHDAQAYADWLSQQSGKRYRLPTEAEWEYVARAGKDTRYTWGNELGKKNANCKGCGSLWDNMQLAPVGKFAPNAYGIYDLHGNAWEWVEDCYHSSYNQAPLDSRARVDGNCDIRALRGGSWRGTEDTLRITKRQWYQADYSNDMTGIRLVRDLENTTNLATK